MTNWQTKRSDSAGTETLALKRVVFWDPEEPTATRPLAINVLGDNLYFPTVDLTKNVCELVDFYGDVAATYDYAPFGAVSAGTPSGSAVPANPFQFSSEVYDDELGLVYYNYRHYSPALGRWLSRDPIEEEGGLNLYAFVGNCSILTFDDLGLVWSSIIPPGLCSYACSKIPETKLPCCNGEIYNPNEYCCRVVNGKEILTSKNETQTETILTYIELRGRMGVPHLLKHGWIEGSFIPGGSAGFYPRNGSIISLPGEVRSPDPAIKEDLPGWTNRPLYRKVITYPITITANLCEFDRIKSCVLMEIAMGKRLNYIMIFYRDCEIWATNLIKKCTGVSI